MAALVRYHFEYGWSTLKSGKRGKRWIHIAVTRFCPVEACELCGRLGSPTWVRRWYIQPWMDRDGQEPKLCMGCMNKLLPHWRAQECIRENEALIRNFKKEIALVNAENRRRVALVPD